MDDPSPAGPGSPLGVGTHFLLLYTRGGDTKARTWVQRETEEELVEHMLELCEEEHLTKVKRQTQAFGRPLPEVVQYDASDLLNFLDYRLTDLVVMKYDPKHQQYEPRGRSWFKSRIYEFLQAQLPLQEE